MSLGMLGAVQSPIDNPQSAISSSGSLLWQLVFVSFAVILMLFEVVRGWRLGLMRQIMRLAAIAAGCTAGFFGGRPFVPLARAFLKMPDPILSILCGAALALITCVALSGLGAILFRRTAQLNSGFARIICGFAGSVLGFFFGLLILWLVVVSVRAVGAVAEAQLRRRAPPEYADKSGMWHALEVRRRFLAESNDDCAAFAASLARLKNSVERGPLGEAVRQIDPVPQKNYEMLGKLAAVLYSPERTRRFLSFPGARELSEHPKIAALRDDPEIAATIAQGQFLELLRNPRVIEVANDPVIAKRIKKFQFERALDYALERDSLKR
jgi:uncharacterized membrane protein required for colicin V production